MALYDITKIDLYSIEGLKRGEMCNIHSVMLFLYSKYRNSPSIAFAYSEIKWMNRNLAAKTLSKMEELKIIEVMQRPDGSFSHRLIEVELKPNDVIQCTLNRNKLINFEKYLNTKLSKEALKEVLGCGQIKEHFNENQVGSWIRNVNNGVWDLLTFLTFVKVLTFFPSDHRIKTFSLQKYMAKTGMTFSSIVKFLYSKVPLDKQDIIYLQFENTLKARKIKNNKIFQDMVCSYLNDIKKDTV